MGLHQEGKAAESVAALRQMLIMTANVRRDGEIVEIPAEELVPGDIVSFEAGAKVPADGRILVAATLEIEEAGLTGESTPVAKGTDPVPGDDVPLGDRVDMAYMNSQVTRGRGEIVVTATGMATEVGHISGMLSGVEQEKTPLTKQLDQITVLITIMAAAALVLIVILGLARGEDFDSLAVVAWAEDRYGLAVATTMGLATTSLLHIAAALEWRDPFRSVFNRNTIANGRFNILMLVALALTFLVTTVDGLERIFDTVELTGSQWRVCFVAVVSYLVLAELGKLVLRHIDREAADGRADANTRTTP
jgi:magnesium-transporting ATPase (P-type)